MPSYRALEHNTNMGMGFYNAGKLISHGGWPRCFSGKVEPADDGAARILSYWVQNQRNGGFMPSTPFNADHNRFFLPAHLPGIRGERFPALPREPLDTMPKYRVRWANKPFANVTVKVGDEISYCGWPESGMSIEPINEPARKVVAYYDIYKDNPKLLPAPWCEYERAIFLPELPTPKRLGAGRKPNVGTNMDDHDSVESWKRANTPPPPPSQRPAARRRGI